MTRVIVSFINDPQGRQRVAFASDLAIKLGRKLIILFPEEDRWRRHLVQKTQGDAVPFVSIVPHLIEAELRERGLVDDRVTFELKRGSIHGRVYELNDLLVTHDVSAPNGLTVISLRNETSVFGHGEGPVMIPFGSGSTAVQVLRAAIDVIKSLGQSVIFYHTTWSEDAVSSDSPKDHMCPSAQDILLQLHALAAEHEIVSEEIIECASVVDGGIVSSALQHNVALLVMGYAGNVGRGSYVDQVKERSPIPVMVMGTQVMS